MFVSAICCVDFSFIYLQLSLFLDFLDFFISVVPKFLLPKKFLITITVMLRSEN